VGARRSAGASEGELERWVERVLDAVIGV